MNSFYFKKQKTKISFWQDGNTRLSAAVIFSLVFLSIIYLAQTNALIDKNFQLRSLQKSLTQKKQQNQQIIVSLTKVQSLGSLEETAKGLNLVPLDQIQYLNNLPGSFASSQ